MGSSYIVILAAGLNGLGAIRSAHKAGLKPIVVTFSEIDISMYSRLYLKTYFLEEQSSSNLKGILKEISIEFGTASLIACSDMGAELLSGLSAAEILPHVAVSPAPHTVELLNDKTLECKAVESAGVKLPKTYYEVENCVVDNLPLIVKPRTYKDYIKLGMKNKIIETGADLTDFLVEYRPIVKSLVAQEIITGNDNLLWVCNVTFDLDSNLAGCFIFNRLGTMPSHYGVTSIALSQSNSALEERCKLIGRAFKYTGPAMIEFKRDSTSGDYYYIETNPRLGMCNWFDTQCGINNVKMCHSIAFGFPAESAKQKENIYYFNFLGDLTARLENRESLLSIVSLYLSFLARKKVSPTLVWYDPAPWFIYCGKHIKDISNRAKNKFRFALSNHLQYFFQK